MCCRQDNFMVVNQKVVKVISIDNQKVFIMTTQILGQVICCHNEDFLTTYCFMGCQNRHRQNNNLIELIDVSAITF